VPKTNQQKLLRLRELPRLTEKDSILIFKLYLNHALNKMSPQAKRRKPLSASVKANLKKKAEGTRFFYGELAAVYRKGQGAYLSSGSRNVPMAAWAMGRVNSYMRGDKARTADAAIYSRYNKRR
tara:strand:- start:244 stop:615 length:372 start_codon:yes stop_codon:yes gene_type:complete